MKAELINANGSGGDWKQMKAERRMKSIERKASESRMKAELKQMKTQEKAE